MKQRETSRCKLVQFFFAMKAGKVDDDRLAPLLLSVGRSVGRSACSALFGAAIEE